MKAIDVFKSKLLGDEEPVFNWKGSVGCTEVKCTSDCPHFEECISEAYKSLCPEDIGCSTHCSSTCGVLDDNDMCEKCWNEECI